MWRDGGVRTEGEFGDGATFVAMDGLPADPARARRAFLAPVTDPEPANVHRLRGADIARRADIATGGGESDSPD